MNVKVSEVKVYVHEHVLLIPHAHILRVNVHVELLDLNATTHVVSAQEYVYASLSAHVYACVHLPHLQAIIISSICACDHYTCALFLRI